mgnify:CR=1 FL=1
MPEFSLPHDHGAHQHEEEVRRVLLQNKEERHLRGGEATRIKYSALHGRGKE